ncbi:hypothetical protein BDV26DRAFT_300751 [Aspergillus bertholletiae]|uniref:Uncharacterized protein n=1 Tax=Aspergillus bertholletiae TaxID=1226010 RepID=A0A5N7AVK4_9EURO|nr:hypothetical protein BDV26DRAFT_300751 [Aspergillus bertholletiae]
MARFTHFFTALYALYSLPLISAWTFVWRNASNTPTVEEGTAAQPCKTIDQAKGKSFEFDAEDSIVRIYLYGSPNCTDDPGGISEHYLAKNASSAIRGFAVIDLSGANTTTSGELEPFPGADWFKSSPSSPIVTAMGKRLVAEDCGKYTDGPGPQWTDADRKSYQCWQEKLGYTGADADGWPGKTSWDQLKVPLTETTGPSTTTVTPSSTSTATGTPTGTSPPDANASSKSSLGGGAIAGIVVGSVVGLGLIGAICYLAQRIGRRSGRASGGEPVEPVPGGGVGGENNDASGAGVAGESSPTEKLPPEAEATVATNQKEHFAELPGDAARLELSDSQRVFELGDGRT